jgi:hypothetical protein
MPIWADLNERQRQYMQFSVIDQCKLTNSSFLYQLAYYIHSEATLVPKQPDQVCKLKPCLHQ